MEDKLRILNFELNHVKEAREIAIANYNEERECVQILPCIDIFPDLEQFASNELGVAAFDGSRMVGFLCSYKPWDNAFGSMAKGIFSPIHAHGAIKENRGMIYKQMYQAAAEKWVKNKIAYHAVALYAHDYESINAFFTYGFGLRCIEAIRPMELLEHPVCGDITFGELAKTEVIQVREMRRMLSEHMSSSPCFMYTSLKDFEQSLIHEEGRNSRLFVARDKEKLIAFVEITNGGENFVTEVDGMLNICGAYCLPEYRGKNIYHSLLNYTSLLLESEGYKLLGVEFEGFNPTAKGFWTKYFTAYTNSVVRRIDECAFHD